MTRIARPLPILAFAALAASLAPRAAAAQAPPDVVITTDGGMLRGTITESVPRIGRMNSLSRPASAVPHTFS